MRKNVDLRRILLSGAAGLIGAIIAMLLVKTVMAQNRLSLHTEREMISYMVGMDVADSLQPVKEDLDLDAFARGLGNALDDQPPLISDEAMAALMPILNQRAAARGGQQIPGLAPGSAPPDVDPAQVGLLISAQVGQQLRPLAEDIELPILLQAIHTVLSGQTALLGQEQRTQIAERYNQILQERAQAAAQATLASGREFLEQNKHQPGVFTTGSGLQYSVLRNGSGPRPGATSRVRVYYHGTLLDGTVFDSSVQRGEPVDFNLNQVIPGWTEGVALMPVGARYRFWIPSELAYGTAGSPPIIKPNSVLVFDVELLDIL